MSIKSAVFKISQETSFIGNAAKLAIRDDDLDEFVQEFTDQINLGFREKFIQLYGRDIVKTLCPYMTFEEMRRDAIQHGMRVEKKLLTNYYMLNVTKNNQTQSHPFDDQITPAEFKKLLKQFT